MRAHDGPNGMSWVHGIENGLGYRVFHAGIIAHLVIITILRTVHVIIDMHNHIGVSRDSAKCEADELLQLMDHNEIAKSVIFALDEEDKGISYEKQNARILDIAQTYPERFIPFCRIQPKAGNKGVDEFVKCMKLGSKGLKLHPHSESFFIEDCIDLFRVASEYQCPVIIHTEHHATRKPRYWQGVFEKYKTNTFILSHGGQDFFRDTADMVRDLPNVYLDTSAQSYHRTRILIQKAGVHKILFASDYPYSHPQIEKTKFEVLRLSQEDQNKIFYENALKVLKIEK